MPAPSGVVTFLFTDVEGSTRRGESDAGAMRVALAAHDDVLRAAIETHGGWLFKHTRDGGCAAFASPPPAGAGAGSARRAVGATDTPAGRSGVRAKQLNGPRMRARGGGNRGEIAPAGRLEGSGRSRQDPPGHRGRDPPGG